MRSNLYLTDHELLLLTYNKKQIADLRKEIGIYHLVLLLMHIIFYTFF